MLRYVLELPTDTCEKTDACDVGVNRKRPEMNKRLGLCNHHDSMAYVDSGFCHRVNEICALREFYAEYNDSFLQTIRHNISVPSSRVTHSRLGLLDP